MLKTFVVNNTIQVTKDGKPYCVIQAATDEDCRNIQNIITAQPAESVGDLSQPDNRPYVPLQTAHNAGGLSEPKQPDVNAELLGALKYAHSMMQPFCDDAIVKQAIARAEQKGGV